MNVLKEYKQIGTKQNSSIFEGDVVWIQVNDKNEDWPDLGMFKKLLSRILVVHYSAFREEQKRRRPQQQDQRQTFLEEIVFQCAFGYERNKAIAK